MTLAVEHDTPGKMALAVSQDYPRPESSSCGIVGCSIISMSYHSVSCGRIVGLFFALNDLGQVRASSRASPIMSVPSHLDALDPYPKSLSSGLPTVATSIRLIPKQACLLPKPPRNTVHLGVCLRPPDAILLQNPRHELFPTSGLFASHILVGWCWPPLPVVLQSALVSDREHSPASQCPWHHRRRANHPPEHRHQ